MTGKSVRLGSPADGNTVSDFDPEEIKRQISIYTAIAPVEYNGCKINVLDTPGNFDFSGEVLEALRVSDLAVIVSDAKAGGVSVGTERAWNYLEARKIPRMIFISKIDEDNADYNSAFDALRQRFGKNIAPVTSPIWDENKKVVGIIDVVNKRAYEVRNNERLEIPIPENKKPVVKELYDALMESVAETSEAFMEKYFAGEEFTYAEVLQGLKQGVREGTLVPVLSGSAINGLGVLTLLDTII